MLNVPLKSSRNIPNSKSCVDYPGKSGLMDDMDHFDKTRELMVKAMICLEDALGDGLPAQAPSSDTKQVGVGIVAFKNRMDEAYCFIAQAEEALKRVERDGG